jgi:hypothetical protein
MNFIKVGNIFINLKEVESFEVYGTPTDVSVRFGYRSGHQEIAHINIENDDPTQIIDIDYAEDMVAEAILTAIQNCADADCEDVAEYVEE